MMAERVRAQRVPGQEHPAQLSPARIISPLFSRAPLCIILRIAAPLVLLAVSAIPHQCNTARPAAWAQRFAWHRPAYGSRSSLMPSRYKSSCFNGASVSLLIHIVRGPVVSTTDETIRSPYLPYCPTRSDHWIV